MRETHGGFEYIEGCWSSIVTRAYKTKEMRKQSK